MGVPFRTLSCAGARLKKTYDEAREQKLASKGRGYLAMQNMGLLRER